MTIKGIIHPGGQSCDMITRGWVTPRQRINHADMSEKREDNAPALGGRSARTGREPRLGGENALHHLALSLESDDWRTRKL